MTKRNCTRVLWLVPLMLAFLLLPLAASDIVWNWEVLGTEDVTGYRYRFDDEDSWNEVSSDVTSVRTEAGEVNTIYLESTCDGRHWEDLGYASLHPIVGEENSMFSTRVSISPYSIALVDFYNGHDVEGADYLSITDYGTTVSTELSFNPFDHLALNFGIAYSYAYRKDTVIPDASHFNFVRFGGGIDYTHQIGHGSRFTIGPGMGCIVSMNAGSWNPGSYLGMHMMLEFNITEHFLMGVGTSAAVSYQKASDPLLSSLTWIVDPLALTMTYRF